MNQIKNVPESGITERIDDMTTGEFGVVIRMIESAYPGKFRLNDEQMDVWFDFLGGYQRKELYFGAKDYIKSNPYPPSIFDLIKSTDKYVGASGGN